VHKELIERHAENLRHVDVWELDLGKHFELRCWGPTTLVLYDKNV